MIRTAGLAVQDERDELDDVLDERMHDENFRAAYEDAEHRHELLRGLFAARKLAQLTQSDVAAVMRTTQSAVSDLEGGGSDARLTTLQRYARSVGGHLDVRFVSGSERPRGGVSLGGSG